MRMRREAFKEQRKTKTCKRQPKVKMMSSKDVPNDLVQDRSIPSVIIGTDVVSLYPNIKW